MKVWLTSLELAFDRPDDCLAGIFAAASAALAFDVTVMLLTLASVAGVPVAAMYQKTCG
jgi:hypothetical protein